MRLSTSTCIYDRVLWQQKVHFNAHETIERCVRTGYTILDMDYSIYSGEGLPFDRDDWQQWIADLNELSLRLGVQYPQAHAHFYNPIGLSPEQTAYNEEQVRRTIVASGMMQARNVVMHPLTVLDGTWYSHRKSLAQNREYFLRHGELARSLGLTIAIENMIENKTIRRYCSSTEELLELIDALNDPMFGICWDFGHANLSNVNQCEALKAIAPHLTALHVNDNRGEKDDHLAPYFGNMTTWESIMRTLGEINYRGDFTFEIHRFTNGLPEAMHDEAVRFTHTLGEYLLSLVPGTKLTAF